MGQSVSEIRSNAEELKDDAEERLQILEKMVHSRLEKERDNILAGQRNDDEIYGGTVVELIKQVHVKMTSESKSEAKDLDKAIGDFFKGAFLQGLGGLVNMGIRGVLANTSIGEYESSSMFILWKNNALVRCDVYVYRWNFTSSSVIKDVDGATGILMVQRVVDITKTDPQVLTWAISRQASILGQSDSANSMIDQATKVLQKVASLQKEFKTIEIEDETTNTEHH